MIDETAVLPRRIKHCSPCQSEPSPALGNGGSRGINPAAKQVLKLITVVCDDRLHPVHVYLMKLSLDDGWINDEFRRDSVKLITAEERWGGGTRRAEFQCLPRLHRQMYWAYGGYIVLSIVAFGLISLFNAEALASGSRLARSFCLYVALFWGIGSTLQAVLDVKGASDGLVVETRVSRPNRIVSCISPRYTDGRPYTRGPREGHGNGPDSSRKVFTKLRARQLATRRPAEPSVAVAGDQGVQESRTNRGITISVNRKGQGHRNRRAIRSAAVDG